jgi:pimeloyl-ACP methyl ester carboxylesterase
MKYSRLILLSISLFTTSLTVNAQEQACIALTNWAEGADDLAITEANFYTNRELTNPFGPAQSLPSHCHVTGSFEHRVGSDGKDYAISFAINMPANWNGRYLFQGGGGLNGSVGEPLGARYAGNQSALEQGFAVVSNDSGHSGGGFDGSFMRDQQAMLNFQYQANAKVAELTRPMVESYYQAPAHHSYFLGCSTGGREGMIMSQRYPQLFDGIVSGAPAMRTGVSNLALRWVSVELGKANNTSARDPFTDAEEELIMSALLARCDALDGQEDGLIFNRTSCDFDPRQISCSMTDAAQCLANDKAEALAKAMGGPMSSSGLEVYAPFPWDTGIDDTGGLPGLLVAGGSPPEGLNGADMDGQNVDAEYIRAVEMEEAIGTTATQYNVSTFINGGGKHLFFHGESDPWFSASETVRYFGEMARSNNWLQPVDAYSRLYLVPGMGHCAGGEQTLDSFDMLSPLVEWVEADEAPGSVVATGQSMPNQSRPLCPYPEYAHFEGGDSSLSENYECRLP